MVNRFIITQRCVVVPVHAEGQLNMLHKHEGQDVQSPEQDLTWLSLQSPGQTELDLICNRYGIPKDLLEDFMDRDEAAHVEAEENYSLFIIRAPIERLDSNDMYGTTPFWMIFAADTVITICPEPVSYIEPLMRRILAKKRSGYLLTESSHFAGDIFLSTYLEILDQYQIYLRSIDSLTKVREKDLYDSLKRSIFPKILQLQKSLVYFTTSLKSNEKVLALFRKDRDRMQLPMDPEASLVLTPYATDPDLFEDVMIEHKQALEMTNIYSTILTNLTSTFDTVISQNLNMVMKRLTIISLIFMIPTFIASVFGMNVQLPGSDDPNALYYIVGGAAGLTIVSFIFMKIRRLL